MSPSNDVLSGRVDMESKTEGSHCIAKAHEDIWIISGLPVSKTTCA